MRRLKTHFEQIPVEVVKKIIEAEVAAKKQTDGNDDVIVETPPSKAEPSSGHSLQKGSLKMAASLGMEYRDDDLQYPDWQSPVQVAVLEFDRDKLKALEAEAAIFNRLLAISQDTDHTAERQGIEDALASFRKTNMTAQYRTFEDESTVDLERAEDALRENEDRYRTLFDLAPVAVYSCDASGVIRDYNNRAAELWGRKPQRSDTDERFCGSFKLYRPDGSFMPHEQCPMGDVLTGKIPGTHDAEVHIERPDGSRIIVIVNIAPLKDDRGEITGAINCFYDVTERKQAEEALRESVTERVRAEEALRENEVQLRLANEKLESVVQKRTASLRHLSAKLMRSQDEEHRRIARNLHDSLGQYLASIKMNLDSLSRADAPNKDEVLSAALESVERSIAETRTLSCLLHPPLLDEVGFASAARWYTDEFAKRSGIEVKLHLPDGIDRLPELTEIALFRILQESLTNVHRHSGSSSVEIGLTVTENQVLLSVRDFGRGMPAGLRQGSDLNGGHLGVGLSGMRERVTDLGGSFDIESNSHGTAIIVALPWLNSLPVSHVPVKGVSGRILRPEGSHPHFEGSPHGFGYQHRRPSCDQL